MRGEQEEGEGEIVGEKGEETEDEKGEEWKRRCFRDCELRLGDVDWI